jgi:hypothetical protein
MVNMVSLGAAGSPRRVAGGNSKSKLALRLCAETGHRHDEAAAIRIAAEIVRDERFQEQLLSIADEYDALAASIEVQGHSRDDRA